MVLIPQQVDRISFIYISNSVAYMNIYISVYLYSQLGIPNNQSHSTPVRTFFSSTTSDNNNNNGDPDDLVPISATCGNHHSILLSSTYPILSYLILS